MRVLMCGDRRWDNYKSVLKQVQALVAKHGTKDLIIIHGGAPGADQMAGIAANECSVHSARVDALWATRHKGAGPQRNEAMLLLQPDLVIGFHSDLKSSRGTKDMLAQAGKAGIKFKLVQG